MNSDETARLRTRLRNQAMSIALGELSEKVPKLDTDLKDWALDVELSDPDYTFKDGWMRVANSLSELDQLIKTIKRLAKEMRIADLPVSKP